MLHRVFKAYFIFSRSWLGSPLGIRGKVWNKLKNKLCPVFLIYFFLIFSSGCAAQKEIHNLVPTTIGEAPNYWCTWYWQNYLIHKGQAVINPDAATIYTNKAARESMNEENIFGKQGMAVVMLPKTRSDYYFVIDHGWQDKSISENTFFTLLMDTLDFPRYARLAPKDRIKQMNEDIKALGWKGLGLWTRGNPTEAEIKKFVEWSRYAGVEYWKVDGGDTNHFFASKIKKEIYPKLTLEQITGCPPLNLKWNIPGLSIYPSIYNREEAILLKQKDASNTALNKVEQSLNIIKNTDVFRTYDAAPLLVTTTTLQRVNDLLKETCGNNEYKAYLNIQDDCNVAAALGLLVAVKRHPMKTPRNYKGKDFHLQISGDRHVDKRLNEMDRLAMWQRIAPPMPAGYGAYFASKHTLIDSIVFDVSDTWYKPTHGKMVRQSAPAIMSRNIALPEVKFKDLAPYVMASKFPNGAVAIATEGRVMPDNSWIHPKAEILLKEVEIGKPIGIFGYYKSLTLEFAEPLPKQIKVYGQDLLSKKAIDITSKIDLEKNKIIIQGDLIEEIGTMYNDSEDISVPGMVIKTNQSRSIYHKDWIDFNKNNKKDIYENRNESISRRIEDLLSQMTIEEKTAQMATLYGYGRVLKDQLPTPQWKNEVWKDGLANIDEHCNGVVESDYMYPYEKHVFALNAVQKFFVEQTRLGIPVEFTNEGIRGLNHAKATCFPAQIGIGSTWDKKLVRKIGNITGKEAKAMSYHNVYSPILDVARDQRWGRIVETYGEDPFLVAELGLQQIKGIQEQGITSTVKHFAVYSAPKGGRDGWVRTDPHIAQREMHTIYLYPFNRAFMEAKAMGVMSAYNDYDGIPVTGSSYFLTDLLRRTYGFKGYVTSDSDAVINIWNKHHVARDYKDAVRQAVLAGLNVRTTFNSPENFLTPLRELVTDGDIPMDVIDDRVRDVLRVKFMEGLFDRPFHNEKNITEHINTPSHNKVALQASRASMVLLKNESGMLPLNPDKYKNILVCGPLAKNEKTSMSRYGPNHIDVISGFEGILNYVKNKAQLSYAQGCLVYDKNTWPESELYPVQIGLAEKKLIDEAVEKARRSDVIIVFLGEDETIVGENNSRSSLNLPGNQRKLLMELHKTGKPIVLVLINGRPLSVNWADAHIPAIVEAWFPGQHGGTAIADVLFGNYNPGGKMPVTTPKTVGQIPFNFPFKPFSQAGQGKEGKQGITRVASALYPFGYGLSYTKFTYSNLKINQVKDDTNPGFNISFIIRNTGAYDGDEVVQLYVNDEVSSVTQYEKLLRGFERIHLTIGEEKHIDFFIAKKDLQLLDRDMKWRTEPGKFNVFIGSSSEDIRLKGSFNIDE